VLAGAGMSAGAWPVACGALAEAGNALNLSGVSFLFFARFFFLTRFLFFARFFFFRRCIAVTAAVAVL
jgi:hypothetical protein